MRERRASIFMCVSACVRERETERQDERPITNRPESAREKEDGGRREGGGERAAQRETVREGGRTGGGRRRGARRRKEGGGAREGVREPKVDVGGQTARQLVWD